MKLLRNCHKALPEDGKLIVVECVLPEVVDTGLATISHIIHLKQQKGRPLPLRQEEKEEAATTLHWEEEED